VRRPTAGRPATAVRVLDPERRPTLDAAGAVRSLQAADLTLPPDQVRALFSPTGLERLARSYWRYLGRVSLGLIRVRYTPAERQIVVLGRPLVLLSFAPPEYAVDRARASVRWAIRGGLLLDPAGRGGAGTLELGLRRVDAGGRVHIEVAVTAFRPSLAEIFGRRFYEATQSRIHVLITHAFLRSLARLDLTRPVPGRHPGG
jgi:hypothetical protein